MSFVAVIGHYMSPQYKVETVLLGLRRLRGNHTGKIMAEAILKVIRKYELTGDQIGWFVLDNASSNDTCVREILKALNIEDTVEHRRLRCLGHIINLAAKAFFFGSGSESKSFEKDVKNTQESREEKKEREIWRKKGPIGKLHNVVMYILDSPQRIDEFEEKVKGEIERQQRETAPPGEDEDEDDEVLKRPLMVIRDNATRWNSVFSMITRAFILKDPLDLFIKRAREKPASASPLPEEDELSASDWKVLTRTQEILKPFYNLTLALQGRAPDALHGSIWEALPALDFLLHGLESKCDEYKVELTETPQDNTTESTTRTKERKLARKANEYDDIKHISTAINNCWAKLRKYHRLMAQSPAYAAAIVLNPEHKLDYFENHWKEHPEWIGEAEKSVEDLWLTMYKDSSEPEKASTQASAAKNASLFHPMPQRELSDFDRWISGRKYGPKSKQDEYEQYLATDYFPDRGAKDGCLSAPVNICAFWARYEAQYPSLARMAFDVLSIPAMSAECERVFSSSKILLDDRRARMKEDIVEASECLRAWLQSGQCDHS